MPFFLMKASISFCVYGFIIAKKQWFDPAMGSVTHDVGAHFRYNLCLMDTPVFLMGKFQEMNRKRGCAHTQTVS